MEKLEQSFNKILKAMSPGDSQFYRIEVSDGNGTLIYNPGTREFGKVVNFGAHCYDGVSTFEPVKMSREVELYDSVRKNAIQITRVPKQNYCTIYPEKILVKFGGLE